MFSRFTLLGKRPFSVSLLFCLFIGCTFAGCACYFAFCCSVGAPLVFSCIFGRLLSARFPVVHFFRFCFFSRHSVSVSLHFRMLIDRTCAGCVGFCTFGCSAGTLLWFPCILACLLASRFLVGHVIALLVAR